MSNLITFKPGDKTPITKNFKRYEFQCPCGCTYQQVDELLVQKLEIIRTGYNTPLKITSGYRTHEEQQKLWNANPNPKMVARPGTSNHEKGNAIDFADTSGAYDWLKKNAGKFGFKNYPPEPWHYSLDGH